MICFHFTIFVVLETTYFVMLLTASALWFAFILLSLSYWKQPLRLRPSGIVRCDLLSFYYLCRTGNNNTEMLDKVEGVVICFHFTIFVVLETTFTFYNYGRNSLWFAFILLSLSYWKQPHGFCRAIVTGCDLLSFYYLCRTGNNGWAERSGATPVVICFHFTIFVVLETTLYFPMPFRNMLWFAFILLSLSYWKQHSIKNLFPDFVNASPKNRPQIMVRFACAAP